MLICLDPGHGATCYNGSPDGLLKEHELVWDIACRVKTMLERHGVQVIMTRDAVTDTTLAERCRIANSAKADYFVSLHSNAAGEDGWTTANGWEIYVVGTGGKAEQLAKKIRTHTMELTALKDRGIKTANFYVIKYTDMPAVLIEHGFHDNRNDAEKLKNPDFRQLLAEADAKGILEQIGIKYRTEWTEAEEGNKSIREVFDNFRKCLSELEERIKEAGLI